VKPPELTIPGFLAHLPVDPVLGLPIPVTSARDPATGQGRFGVNDTAAKLMCAAAELCGVCGRLIWGPMVFLAADPGQDPARVVFPDPPMHEACARWSMTACPAISTPNRKRPRWLRVGCDGYQVGPPPPGAGARVFVFRPVPPLVVTRYAYDPDGVLAEVTP
jgi:hypothetical protein